MIANIGAMCALRWKRKASFLATKNAINQARPSAGHQGAPMIQDTLFAIALGLAGATFLFLALS